MYRSSSLADYTSYKASVASVSQGERYTFTTSIVVSKHQKEGELGDDPAQNKYTPSPSNFNDESLNEYTMNRPPEEPQQWDSDY